MNPHPFVSPHRFYIPVMGTSFTIDTPLKVAKYGISSVVSLSDDYLIETMRRHYCALAGEEYREIRNNAVDKRSRRITAYLNLLNRIVERQIDAVRKSSFDSDSEINRYFDMLPDSPQRSLWSKMIRETDPAERMRMQEELREYVVPGSIDVNIMTKVDPEIYRKGRQVERQYGIALSALRGFAHSDLKSSVVFSAGLNPNLYSYTAQFQDFFPNSHGEFAKKIILKVSDYRSAMIQGKFLARKGLWVSEFRIESGINCGGHAFLKDGQLIGPVLDEFVTKRQELYDMLSDYYIKALSAAGYSMDFVPDKIRFTVQGGVGTNEEAEFLLNYYGMDAVGWGTPFLLVPEVVSIDDIHLGKLAEADGNDVQLSAASPLGIPFWNLKNSESELERIRRIQKGQPGSPCPKGYLAFNKEFEDKPLCTASSKYKKRKLAELESGSITESEKRIYKEDLLAKACLCGDLAGSAQIKTRDKKNAKPIICPGPNIVNFSVISSLKEMVDHILGRISLLKKPGRIHMFIREMQLFIDNFKTSLGRNPKALLDNAAEHIADFKQNISSGLKYYARLARHIAAEKKIDFLEALDNVRAEFNRMCEILDEITSPELNKNPA